jgi:transcriptional regulator with XRE-family HTH domain
MSSKYTANLVDSATLGRVVERVRISQKLTQREFAKKYGITQRWLSELEPGKSAKNIEKVLRLCRENGIKITAEFEINE